MNYQDAMRFDYLNKTNANEVAQKPPGTIRFVRGTVTARKDHWGEERYLITIEGVYKAEGHLDLIEATVEKDGQMWREYQTAKLASVYIPTEVDVQLIEEQVVKYEYPDHEGD